MRHRVAIEDVLNEFVKLAVLTIDYHFDPPVCLPFCSNPLVLSSGRALCT